MSKATLIFRWMGINGLFLGLTFLVTAVLTRLFPEAMLAVFGRWAALLSFFGAKSAAELGSATGMFWQIVRSNTITVLMYFLIGLVLQGPLAMIFGGAFYSLIAFLTPLTLGRSFAWNDWLLILLEMVMLTLAASLGMAVSGVLYEVPPTLSGWWAYARQSWRSLGFDTPAGWRAILARWRWTVLVGLLVTLALLFLVAWYETFGY